MHQGWGADKTEAVAEVQGEADAQAEATAGGAGPDWGAAPEADWGAPEGDAAAAGTTPGKEDAQPSRPVEEEDKTMTLEEYLASKTDSLTELVGSVGPREANEGNADLFKDAQKLVKPQEGESYFAGLTKVRTSVGR